MSPEQAKGKPVDKRTDIWAFGCVLYEMLAGRRAFEGEDVSDTLAAILRGEPDGRGCPRCRPRCTRSFADAWSATGAGASGRCPRCDSSRGSRGAVVTEFRRCGGGRRRGAGTAGRRCGAGAPPGLRAWRHSACRSRRPRRRRRRRGFTRSGPPPLARAPVARFLLSRLKAGRLGCVRLLRCHPVATNWPISTNSQLLLRRFSEFEMGRSRPRTWD